MICPFNPSFRCAPRPCSFGNTIDELDRQVEPVNLVVDRKFQRSVDVALFLVAAHMDVGVVHSAIRELVDQPRISMEVEDHGLSLVNRESNSRCRKAVRMFSRRLQRIQTDDVDEADLQIR
jgi:hypothetical protein